MSTVQETTVDLTTVVRDLERLASELRAPRLRRIPPEISAACDALSCAAVLLRTQQHVPGGDAMRRELLFDAVALARSTVEATKVACRERARARAGGSGA
ncbi:hypothetical protein ACH4FX_34290 [Streptomyces sp. NPDC018019]|uniref:hypothetical protein n=1 Tax=Streptomyces sp. NPDC018019 TaxID=3365030 RepID=UPI003790106B